MSELADRLQPIVDGLKATSDGLTDVGTQITKATAEIIAALANTQIPEDAKAKLDSLSALGDALKTQAAGLKTASQALDDLNPDTPPAPPTT